SGPAPPSEPCASWWRCSAASSSSASATISPPAPLPRGKTPRRSPPATRPCALARSTSPPPTAAPRSASRSSPKGWRRLPESPSGDDPTERGACLLARIGGLEHVAVPREDAHEIPGQHPLDAGLQGAPILGQPI